MTAETEVASFVVRFVYDEEQPERSRRTKPPRWHGLIRHVQTDETITFTDWAEALRFMRQFVPIELKDVDE